MPQISGAAELRKRVRNLQTFSAQLEEKVIEKRRWLDKQDEKYRESTKGQEWEEYIDHLDDLLTGIASLPLDRY